MSFVFVHVMTLRCFAGLTASPLDGNAASVSSHRKLFGRASACKSDPTKVTGTQPAASPWFRAGVASTLIMRLIDDNGEQFFGNQSGAAIRALMSTRPN
jgi:hypothetical protein